MKAGLMWSVGFAGLVAIAAVGQETTTSNKTGSAEQKIGVYDSRAIAVAYAGTDTFSKWLGGVRADYDKAKKAGDSKRTAEIDKQMRDQQVLMHKQAFSTERVTEIIKTLEPSVARLKKDLGLEGVVSKWDEAALAKYKSAKQVDITSRLIDDIAPSEKQRKHALEILKHTPISLKDAENIRD